MPGGDDATRHDTMARCVRACDIARCLIVIAQSVKVFCLFYAAWWCGIYSFLFFCYVHKTRPTDVRSTYVVTYPYAAAAMAVMHSHLKRCTGISFKKRKEKGRNTFSTLAVGGQSERKTVGQRISISQRGRGRGRRWQRRRHWPSVIEEERHHSHSWEP